MAADLWSGVINGTDQKDTKDVLCSGLNSVSPTPYQIPVYMEPQNVIFFGNRVFIDVIS